MYKNFEKIAKNAKNAVNVFYSKTTTNNLIKLNIYDNQLGSHKYS